MMALRTDGAVAGSVSGGCIEDDLIDQVRRSGFGALVPNGMPRVVTYGVDAEQAHRFGLPCGGTLELAMELLDNVESVDALVDRLRRRKTTLRVLNVQTGEVCYSDADTTTVVQYDGTYVKNVLGPVHRLLVIGAGQVSRYLCQGAVGLGFDVTVCDPREEYFCDWSVEGTSLVHDMPDDVVQSMNVDDRTAIIALTHDPKLDDLAIMDAVRSPAFYVGALGSRVNNAKRVERLRTYFGLSDLELGRLHGPAGIYLGSRTPSEIALSILSQIVAAKNGIVSDAKVGTAEGKAMIEKRKESLA